MNPSVNEEAGRDLLVTASSVVAPTSSPGWRYPGAIQLRTLAAKANDSYLPGLLMFGCVVLFALLALNQQRPPKAVAANAPPAEFSSGRAIKHIEVIARAPHEMGSAEHAAVRDYIVGELTALGASPQIQKTTVVSTRRGSPVAATVENIVARVSGTNSNKAILLVAHYDSVSTGPGASDDGAAVAAFLETLRALKSGAPLKNDVIFLFTDGEENGLLGATAFVKEHPWAKDAGVVLNFEARGNSGPSVMFETSGQNGWLIAELAKAAPHPIANSLSYDIYKLLPNDTDFTIFRGAGLPGMNFAYIEGLTRYHSQIDSVSNVDQRSLQHHGAYALALTRHFASLDEVQKKEPNAVYFNVPGSILIHYSSAWIIPLMVVVAIVFLLVMVYGLKKKQLTITGIILGFLACLLNIIVVAAVLFGLWYLISRSNSAYGRMPFGDTYNSSFYFAGFTAFTIAMVASLFVLFRRKISAENLMVGGLLWWLIMLILSGLFLPGGTYLFTWPLLFSLCGLAAVLASKNGQRLTLKLAIVLSLCALPGIILFVPMIDQIFTALTVNLVWATMVFAVLLLWLLIPLLDFLTKRYRWLLSSLALAASLVFIGIGGLTSSFDKQHPEPYHLVYGLDVDANKAVWASAEGWPDKWAAQFFPAGSQRAVLGQFYYKNPRTFLVSSAPMAALPTPTVTVVNDEKKPDNSRLLRLHIDAPPNETSVVINVSSEGKTTQASINGYEINRDGTTEPFQFGTDWGIRYFAPPATGVDLSLEMDTHSPVKVHLVGISRGLPDIPNTPVKTRPEQMMPAPYLQSDSSMVSRTFSFN